MKSLDLYEKFLGFIDYSAKQNAGVLSQYIFDYFNTCKLNKKARIVSQSYDGDSFMDGKFNDIRSKIQNKYPNAVYIHYMALRVDLTVINMCKFVKISVLKILFTYL